MKTSSAFTLLEVLLAVAILTLVGSAIFRFTETTLTATRVAVQSGENAQATNGFARLLQVQLDSLPASGVGGVTGGSIKVGESPRDELVLVCDAPAALLSRRAPGAWRVRLAVRDDPARGGSGTLGMQRLGPAEDATAVDANAPAGPALLTDAATRQQAAAQADNWVPLLENVAGFEVNYFNARLNGWLPKWNDPNALPDCVRVRLTFAGGVGRPLEMILRVPPRTRQQALAPAGPGGATPSTPGAPARVSPQSPGNDDDNG